MSNANKVRMIPVDLSPIVQQAILNLAVCGLVDPEWTNAIISESDRTNAVYDDYMARRRDN